MDQKAVLLGIIIIIIVYMAYKKYYEKFGDRKMSGMMESDISSNHNRRGKIESFGDRKMSGMMESDISSNHNRRGKIESFGNYYQPGMKEVDLSNNKRKRSKGLENYINFDYRKTGSAEPMYADETSALSFSEYLQESTGPGLHARQKQFVTNLNDGDYYKTTSSIVNTAAYEDRESQAYNTIGLRARRRVPMSENQKQITEIVDEGAFADEDPSLGPTVLNRRYLESM